MKKYRPFFIVLGLCMITALTNDSVTDLQTWAVIGLGIGIPFAALFQWMSSLSK
jgi:hypothetical protein